MNLFFSLSLLTALMNPIVIFDFNKNSNINGWQVIDDIVMGGKSSGNFRLQSDGYGLYDGEISIENSGGFSSIRYQFDKVKVKSSNKIVFRVKGSNTNFQLRVKDSTKTKYSYIAEFSTSGNWEVIELELKNMYPSYRGEKLNLPNFSHNQIEEITFLIGNNKSEKFQLLIDKIELH